MKIAFYELTPSEIKIVKSRLNKSLLSFFSGDLTFKNLPASNTEVLCIHTGCIISSKILAKLPNLKLIITRTAGTDHIDLSATEKLNIQVANAPGLNAIAVAEFAFGLLLGYIRQIPSSLVLGKQLKFHSKDYIGTELAGKTLGLVGAGAIGMHVAKIAQGFGMKVIAFDIYKNTTWAKSNSIKYVNLHTLFAQADVISLHIPVTVSTKGIINKSLFTRVKTGAVLINTARGGLVNTADLLHFLQKGKLGGYLADVLSHELVLNRHTNLGSKEILHDIVLQKKLAKLPNVNITPHMAYATKEAVLRILEFSITYIKKYIKDN